jgi:hypothetical protein
MKRCVDAAMKGEDNYNPWTPKRSDEEWMTEFRPLWDEIEQKHPRRWSLVMASYSDEHHVSFWRPATAAARREDAAIHFKNPEGLAAADARLLRDAIDRIPDKLRIRSRMVQKIQQQLREIHGQAVPEPVAGIYMDWNDPPFYAGWHTWVVGSDPDQCDVAHYQPNDCNWSGLHFCGEAWSRDQGWIEGALKTSERVLASLGVPGSERAQQYIDSDFYTYIGKIVRPGDQGAPGGEGRSSATSSISTA